jgi:hypothetical protein
MLLHSAIITKSNLSVLKYDFVQNDQTFRFNIAAEYSFSEPKITTYWPYPFLMESRNQHSEGT